MALVILCLSMLHNRVARPKKKGGRRRKKKDSDDDEEDEIEESEPEIDCMSSSLGTSLTHLHIPVCAICYCCHTYNRRR
jgi:hypothetical protein